MFNRQSYLDKLIQAKDSDFVKVLTGVRRCGKSTLLMLYKDWLLERGVEEDQVIEISYDLDSQKIITWSGAQHLRCYIIATASS